MLQSSIFGNSGAFRSSKKNATAIWSIFGKIERNHKLNTTTNFGKFRGIFGKIQRDRELNRKSKRTKSQRNRELNQKSIEIAFLRFSLNASCCPLPFLVIPEHLVTIWAKLD